VERDRVPKRLFYFIFNFFFWWELRTYETFFEMAKNVNFGDDRGGRDVLYALDFDGVVCDSAGESSLSAFMAAKRAWPELESMLSGDVGSDTAGQDMPAWLKTQMRQLRPIIETGYENLLLIRLLVEEHALNWKPSAVSRGTRPLTIGEIAANWLTLLRDKLLDDYGYSKDQLIDLFGSTRDEWMQQDEAGWLAANRL